MSTNPHLVGDISFFAASNARLEGLVLKDTGVVGDIAALQTMQTLRHMDLSGTDVVGDLHSLISLADVGVLNFCDVSNCANITGSVVR